MRECESERERQRETERLLSRCCSYLREVVRLHGRVVVDGEADVLVEGHVLPAEWGSLQYADEASQDLKLTAVKMAYLIRVFSVTLMEMRCLSPRRSQ